jgi:hypothetical protein
VPKLVQTWYSRDGVTAQYPGQPAKPIRPVVASKGQLARVTVAGTVAPAADPTARPSGPGYTRIEDLMQPGDTVTQAMARLTVPNIITFPEGVFECVDFATGFQAGITVPPICQGIIGSGPGTLGGSSGTIFTIRPMSSTAVAQGWIPAFGSGIPTQTNILKHYPNQPGVKRYENFQVAGTEQGHSYHCMQVFGTPGACQFKNVLLTGWSGKDGRPPDETFGLQVSGVGAHVFDHLEADGRRSVGGEVFGAAGLTFQKCVGATFLSSSVHHCRAANYIFYDSYSCTMRDCLSDAVTGIPTDKMLGNGSINLEAFDDIQIINSTIVGRVGKVHDTASGDQGTLTRDGVTHSAAAGQVEFIDTVFRFGTSTATVPALIQTWDPYSRGTDTVGKSVYTPADAFSNHKADGTHIPYTWILAGVRYQIT